MSLPLSRQPRKISPFASVYLDVWRFCAALIVAMGHFSFGRIGGGLFWQATAFGHQAVLVFFVLSGVVIGYVSDQRESELRQYAAARLARIYISVLPILLVNVLFLTIMSQIDPVISVPLDGLLPGVQTPIENPVLQLLAGLFFLNSVWYLNILVLLDSPYWSLSYEVWYYVIFGCVIYLSGSRRLVFAAAAMLIAGPNVLLMLPIWLFGVAAWHCSHRIGQAAAWSLAIGGLMLAGAMLLPWLRDLGPHGAPRDWPFQYHFSDHGVGLGVALHLLGVLALRLAAPPGWVARIAQAAAGCTFTLYLLHLPVFIFLTAVLPGAATDNWRRATIVAVTAPLVVGIAYWTEQRRGNLRRWLLQHF